ncbi:MAG: pantetheine-phosphate adenylyltransferase [Ardenticatenales bacterium]|nr:pantetheine-phosphate adenylyltransferase [Ardenticatenales bacterium]
MSERIAIYPGSFDPLTDGHLSIIRRASAIFSKLIVVVGYNPKKKTLFSVEERLHFIRESARALPNVSVDSFTGELLVTYTRRVGATIVVRGLRNQADFRNEFQQSKMNQKMLEGLETVFMLSDADEIFVSSTLVRDTIQARGDYSVFVPNIVEVKGSE